MNTKRKNWFKLITVVIIIIMVVLITACNDTNSNVDRTNQKTVSEILVKNQPTPTDIEYSLERYNLIKRAYWVNGQRDKSRALTPPITLPLGYIVLIDHGVVIESHVVSGKVSSLNSYLTPESEYYERNGTGYQNDWLADTDGSFGENDQGIFFFTPDGNYVEWKGSSYRYSDIPISAPNPVLKTKKED